MKKLIYILMLLILSTVAFADQCYVGSDCYIYHEVSDGVYDQVYLNVTAENGSTIFAVNMSQQAGDLYFYNHNFEEGGDYTAFIQVLNNSIEQSNTTKTFTVRGSGRLLTNICPDTTAGNIVLWGFIAFFVVLVLIGYSMNQLILSMLGGIGLIFASLTALGCSIGMGLLLLAIGLVITITSLTIKT